MEKLTGREEIVKVDLDSSNQWSVNGYCSKKQFKVGKKSSWMAIVVSGLYVGTKGPLQNNPEI